MKKQEKENSNRDVSVESKQSTEFGMFKDKPAIFIDVNLGGSKIQRILIGEEDSIEYVVDEFAKTFKLNNKKKDKLLKVIYKQL